MEVPDFQYVRILGTDCMVHCKFVSRREVTDTGFSCSQADLSDNGYHKPATDQGNCYLYSIMAPLLSV